MAELGRGYILTTRELLHRSLMMPDNAEIYGVEWDVRTDAIRIYVMSPSLPSLHEGEKPRQVAYVVEAGWDLDGDSGPA